jgi:formylglycine-generating enzyme required for sulfatase activity
MASYPAPGGQAGDQGTKSISSSERADRIATSSPAADSQRFDELKIVDAESDTSYIEPETLIVETGTGEIGSSGAVTGIQNFHEANTVAIPDLGETLTEQSIETTMLDRGRTTAPVEGQDEEEESSFKDASTRPITDLGDRGEALDQFAGRLEQPDAGERTVSFGTAPPPPSGELQPEPIDPKTYVIGSGTTEPSPPVLPKFGEAPTKPIDTAPGPVSDPTTAPFGMGHYPPQPQTASRPQQPWPEQPGMPAPMAGPETRVAPVVQPQRRGNLAAILSVVLGGVILLMAGIIFWWYVSGGRGQEPAVQEDVVVNPPAPEPPPPPEVKPPPVPEGMVLVPGGRYTVGRDDGDELASPQRAVDVAPFYIDTTEVTNAEYMLFIDARKRQPPAEWKGDTYPQDRADWPVTGISWQDAADYAAWAGKRLPTEIEWEAAARGPDGRIYPWGNEWKRGLANIGTRGIRGVGQYKEGASPVGAFDMLGNVWEWTADEFALYPGSSAQMPSNIQPGITYRVIRGGAYDGSKINDASYRGYVDANQGYPKTGFRCVKDAR